jgi:hypothetical protein
MRVPGFKSAALACLGCLASAAAQPDLLWYAQPAVNWNEALPIGNGRLGAMIFGGAVHEHFQLNEGTVWAGERRDRNNPAGHEGLVESRRLLLPARSPRRRPWPIGIPYGSRPHLGGNDPQRSSR